MQLLQIIDNVEGYRKSRGHQSRLPHYVKRITIIIKADRQTEGCLLMIPLLLKAKSSENFLSPAPKVPNFGVLGGLGVRG